MSTADTVAFESTIEKLRNWENAPQDAWGFMSALISDLNPQGADYLQQTPEDSYMERVADDSHLRASAIATLEHLSWFPHADVRIFESLRPYTHRKSPHVLFGNDFDVVWLDIHLNDASQITLPNAAVTYFRDACVQHLAGEATGEYATDLRQKLVLLTTIHGPGYQVPDVAVVGPSLPDNERGESPFVKVVLLDLNKAIQGGDSTADLRTKLATLAPLSAGNDNWQRAFKFSLSNRTEIRHQFRKKMQGALLELMNLLEETATTTAGQPKADDDELDILREAATLIAYRLMFLTEVARRGLLYRHESQDRGRTLLELTAGPSERDGELFFALRHLTEAIRGDVHDETVAVSGASIFADCPNEAFDARLTTWLEPLAQLDENSNPDLLRRWDAALQVTAAIVTGELDDHIHLSTAAATGFGGAEHAQRVLGDVYEQILAMVPDRTKKGALQLNLRGKKNASEKDQRKALGAHYTPERLVDEVVRAALRPLFEYHWEESGHDPTTYIEHLEGLRILDPAMGSAHFLTAAALELAREVAYVHLAGEPRPFELHEPTVYPDSHEATLELLDEKGADAEAFTNQIRKRIPGLVQRACFGTDVNPLAAELGKLSLWLFALAVDREQHNERPDLTFLDGNILPGDSLVGVAWHEAVETIRERFGLEIESDSLNAELFRGQLQVRMEQVLKLQDGLRKEADAFIAWVRDIDRQNGILDGLDPQYVNAARRKVLDHANELQQDLRWVYDLAVLADFYRVSTRGKTGAKRLVKALNAHGAKLSEEAYDSDALIWHDLIHKSPRQAPDEVERLRRAIEHLAAHLPGKGKTHRALHWELAFPLVFPRKDDAQRGFDAIVANPPFIGDRDLRGRLGQKMVTYLADRYTRGNKPDYAGFFFLRYDHLVNATGVVGTLGPNSIAQASNRAYVTRRLLFDDASFTASRAMPNRPWPGDAAVHYCMAHFVRPPLMTGRPRLVVPKDDDLQSSQWTTRKLTMDIEHLSSYFDEYPDFALRELPSYSSDIIHQGMILRGNFSVHRQPDQSLAKAIAAVPERERDALAAYLNNRDIQQNAQPTPSDVVIDFFEPLRRVGLENTGASKQRAWLEENYPVLFEQLQTRSPHAPNDECIFEERAALSDSSSNKKHKKYWWLFGSPRHGLRTSWENEKSVMTFGAVTKVWSPNYLSKAESTTGLRICPMHKLFISPIESKVWFGMTASFVFEQLVRRQCSSLKSDLNFSPTDVFPYFPVPWNPHFEEGTCCLTIFPVDDEAAHLQPIARAGEALNEQRTELLANPKDHSIDPAGNWGPTELYNLYDDEECMLAGVEALRRRHVDLFQAVLHAYGWDDLADESGRSEWGFERPWLDRTPRFVPPEPVRREVYRRMGELNEQRYYEELQMYLDRVCEVMEPGEMLSRNKVAEALEARFCPSADGEGNSLDHDVLEAALDYGAEQGVLARESKTRYFVYGLPPN